MAIHLMKPAAPDALRRCLHCGMRLEPGETLRCNDCGELLSRPVPAVPAGGAVRHG